MKQILRWLETKLSRPKSPDLPNAPSTSESANPDEIDLGIDLPKEIQDMVNDDSLPDHVEHEHVETVPDPSLDDQSSPDADKSTGFDPDDTIK